MKSPFPGMDPYIEDRRLWRGFHFTMISEIERTIAALLPDRYFVEIGQRSYIVLEGIGSGSSAERDAEAEVVTMRAFNENPCRETFIKICEIGPPERLVTCIEILSPANKQPGTKGWELYLKKRNSLLLGSHNFVEIDLLRGGQRMPMRDPWPECPYYLLVARKMSGPSCRVWPAHYRRALPEIPIPLNRLEADVQLALQPMVEVVYAQSRYGRRIDYSKPMTQPLPEEDAAWLAKQLEASGEIRR